MKFLFLLLLLIFLLLLFLFPTFFFSSREEKCKQLYSREGSGEEKEWKGSDGRVLQLLGEWDFGEPTDPMLPRP